jgi:hypothetical protein
MRVRFPLGTPFGGNMSFFSQRYEISRGLAICNLKHWFVKTLTLQDYFYGKLSGFPDCCIIWFHLRSLCLDLFELIFSKCPGFIDWDIKSAEHVLCPLCVQDYRKSHKRLKYYYCKKCDNTQFNLKTHCLICGGGVKLVNRIL